MSHETAGLTVMYQPKTGGRGAIMMIPANWHFAFTSLRDPSILARLGGDPNRTDQVAQDLMMDPNVTFRVAAWWFRGGAAIAGMKAPSNATACNDLAAVADGMGMNADRKVLATINECVAGNGDKDPGFDQRVALTGKVLRAVQAEVRNATATVVSSTATVSSTTNVAATATAKAAASGLGEQSSAIRADAGSWTSAVVGAVALAVVARDERAVIVIKNCGSAN
ncbi:hypothetical protein AMAG_15623 [Allomyces macrogynus ATCC 38327]|uniref:Uncharacterized protein n=1 Tax=Allomyces macrogynus (strain ATCC 38327) TaxID=578462 RepID=A0A0L0T9I5_ALLM3|nr:hypothetical protein AMAG_15623 [Allomyces macrogynus ATCC 38327]|eukprot:KNE71386.1 hypothetical protein AMAG_15623 [Allomyces macrogynus ATCC 38327]